MLNLQSFAVNFKNIKTICMWKLLPTLSETTVYTNVSIENTDCLSIGAKVTKSTHILASFATGLYGKKRKIYRNV